MGYHPEVHGFVRACYERITRCLAFSRDPISHMPTFQVKTIQQTEIDRKIRNILKRERTKCPIWEYLRTQYTTSIQTMHIQT